MENVKFFFGGGMEDRCYSRPIRMVYQLVENKNLGVSLSGHSATGQYPLIYLGCRYYL